MAVDKSKVVLTFKHPRSTRLAQELEGRRYFAGSVPHVLHVGQLPKLALDVAKSVREGDTVWLWALPMIVVDRKTAGASHHTQITLFCKEVRGNGGRIVEGSTGRTSESRSQASAMIEEAHKIATHGGKKLPRRNVPAGRKPKPWPSDEVEAAARRLWKSKNIESDAAAIREAQEQWPDVTERMMRNLGKSGRNG
jgi:hypothetical protein